MRIVYIAALALAACSGELPLSMQDEATLMARHAALHKYSPPPGDLRLFLSPAPAPGQYTMPPTIRVWRRLLDGSSSSCAGRVDVVPFTDYVKHVLPHEWLASWNDEALKAGAIAIRSYAANIVMMGGRYSCADVDDSTNCQVYKDESDPKCDADVDATNGAFIADSAGNPVFAEYSAENGSPTADGIDDTFCAGHTVNGHGRGMCQWGTQRWALYGNKTYDWMVTHYFPTATLSTGEPPAVDGAAPPDDGAAPHDAGADGGKTPPRKKHHCSAAPGDAQTPAGGTLVFALLFGFAVLRRSRRRAA